VNFQTLYTRIMARTNLTTATAQTRVQNYINERYRQIATSCGLTKVRFGQVTFPTIPNQYEYQLSSTITTPAQGVIHASTLVYPAGNRILLESTMDSLHVTDPGNLRTGYPVRWAQNKYQSTAVAGVNVATVYIWPKPDLIYTIQVDGILTGIDLVNPTDVPVLPDDFHDILELYGIADELFKTQKTADARVFEAKAESRLKELRYFLAKSVYCGLQQGEHGAWWWGYWWGTYRG
jgi:hypothetical protein